MIKKGDNNSEAIKNFAANTDNGDKKKFLKHK